MTNFRNFLKNVATIVACFAVISIAGCDKEKEDDDGLHDVSGLQTSTVTSIDAAVANVDPDVRVVKLVEIDDDDIFSEDGVFVDGKLKITLPGELPSSVLYGLFNKQNHPGIKLSDENTGFAIAKLEGYNEEGELIGEFDYFNSEKTIIASLFYADRDVTITGKDSGNDTWRVSFKKGWNFLYFADSISTSSPGSMVWIFTSK